VKRDTLLCAAALLAASALVHERALEGFFVADDYTVIGSFWGKGIRYLAGVVASDEIGGVWAERFVRPARPWTLALDGWLWGFEPLGFHLTNVLLHAGASALIGILVLQMGGGMLPALLASLLFLLHPVNVEVATWISGRDESLAAGPLLGAFAFLAAEGSARRPPLGVACALFALSLLAKEYALLLPLALWARAWLSPGRGESRLSALGRSLKGSIPLLAICSAFLALRFRVSGNPFGGYGEGSGAHATVRADLFVDSAHRFAREFCAPFAARPFAAAILLAVPLIFLAAGRKRPEPKASVILFWALLWPILFLLPTHNLVYTPRHLYLSFAGIAVAIGLLLARAEPRRKAPFALSIGGVLAVVLAPSTIASEETYTRMSLSCRTALTSIETAASGFPRGDVLVLVGMPAHEKPPWGFGWSLKEALRPPFVEQAIDSGLEVVFRRQWRPEAWAAFRAKYPGRGIHVIAWNPAFHGIQILRPGAVEPGGRQRSSRQIEITGPGLATLPGRS
jgi:hypothetical protein